MSMSAVPKLNSAKNYWIGFATLVNREIYRFLSVFFQTIVPPLITSFLFIFIFGFALGSKLEQVNGIPYLKFLIPGLIMMYIIESSYTNASSSLFIARWSNHIQEILVTPLSYVEMVLAFLIGSLVRGLMIASGVYVISLLFVRFPIHNPLLVLYFSVFVSLTFASMGVLVGLISEEFEEMSLLTNFLIQPLIYFGGVFHSAAMMPGKLKFITVLNPIYYMINGLRYAMTGYAESDVGMSAGVVLLCFCALFSAAVWLFRIGYKLRS